MDYLVKTERLDARRVGDIGRAAEILRRGGTVAFPTETVYGLGANALDPVAVTKIFEAKQRPGWDPLIVHVCDRAMLGRVARIDGESAVRVERLIEAFWPGALTLLLPRTAEVPDAVTAGRPLVGVRMPAHGVARKLIELAGVPIAAPSANRFGHTSPTTAAHVLTDLDGRIDAVLDGGSTEVGVESTVLDANEVPVVLYRQGGVTVERLRGLLGGDAVRVYVRDGAAGEPESLPSPGVGMRHYAPEASLVLIEQPVAETFDLLADHWWRENATLGVMLPDGWPAAQHGIAFRWGGWEDKDELARRLFEGLRALDDRGATVIVCPLPSAEGIGAAIRDRLEKAARTS